jgi:hypothetical protein
MKAWLIALAVARALDVTSTCQGLAQGQTEWHPVLPTSCRGQIVAQTALASVQILALRKLHKHHPRVATVLGMVSVSIEVGAVAHNWVSLR